MHNLIKIAGYTVRDQLRHKSVYVLLGLSMLFILLVRGCYDGSYRVNGRMLDAVTVAGHISTIVFHLITTGMLLMAAVLSMKTFSRDQADGSLVLFLSRPVCRWQYVLGRVAGTWALCLGFMFSLHVTILLTAWTKTGIFVSGYLAASLVCSISLLFVIACVCLLSLFMPDFISALFTLGIVCVGFVSDGGYRIFNSDLVRAAVAASADWQPALWRVLYPKVFMVQAYADSLISKDPFHPMGPVHPFFNLSFFIVLTLALLVAAFNRKEF